MTAVREILSDGAYLDENGDVKPYSDVASELDRKPVSNVSIIQGTENLQLQQAREEEMARFEDDAKWERLRDKNPGPHVSLEQYYQDQLNLLDFVSGSMMRRGFKNGGSQKQEVRDRYGSDLPRVEAGAHRNHQKAVHDELPEIYHADELKAVGFEEAEIDFDAKTTMRSEAQSRYGGPENKGNRAARRRELKKKLAFYASK